MASNTDRPPHAAGEIAVQFLTAPAEFAALAPDWNRLHEEAAGGSRITPHLDRIYTWRRRLLPA